MTIPSAALVSIISQYAQGTVAGLTAPEDDTIKQASSTDASSSNKMDALTAIIDASVVLLVTYVVMHTITFVIQRRHQLSTFERMKIPGPKPNFISGHLYQSRREPYIYFAERLHENHGKNAGIFLGGDPYVVTKDLDLIQQVFVAKSRLFYDRMNFYMNVEPVPDNLICQRGDRWRYMRKLLTPAFSNQKIRSSQFYRDTQKTVDKFKAQLEANKQPGSNTTMVHDVYDRMAAVALDVIVKTAFHMDDVIPFEGRLDNVQKSTSLSARLAKLLVFPSYVIDLVPYAVGRLQSLLKGGVQSDDQYSSTRAKAIMENADFLSVVKAATRLAFNPLVELIFCFPFLDAPLTFLCSHLYFGSIYSFLLGRLDHLVRRASSPAAAATKAAKQIDSDKTRYTPASPNTSQQQNTNQQQRRRIVDSMIEVLRERKITRTEFLGNAFVILFAGFETTANALTFTLWLLAHNQRVQTKLRQELMSIKSNGHATAADNRATTNDNDNHRYSNSCNQDIVEDKLDLELAELATECSYLEAVINESLRLYPPVPALSCRQASTSCTIDGMNIEKGVNIIPSVYSIHRDKAIWGDRANEFMPERFELLDLNQLNSAMFMPFGLGPRNCIGKAAAMHELKIVIGRLVKEYSIEPVKGVTPSELKLCSPINITITNSETIGLKFVKLL